MAFPRFKDLPKELRLMIWSLAIPTRVIRIYHKEPLPIPVGEPTRRNIKESPPSLLSTCRESRNYAIKIYTSTFPTPTFAPLQWHLKSKHKNYNDRSQTVARRAAAALLPNVYGPGALLTVVIQAVEKHMDSVQYAWQTTQFAPYATQYCKPKGTIMPAFFSPEHDIILFHKGYRYGLSAFLKGVLSPRDAIAGQIRSLAVDVDLLAAQRFTWGKTWLQYDSTVPYKNLASVQELWLLCQLNREVMHITLNSDGTNVPGHWTFSPSLNNATSKQLMDAASTNSGRATFVPVTWKIVVSVPPPKSVSMSNNQNNNNSKTRIKELNFCELVKKYWKPNLVVWEADKRRILMGKNISATWWDANRYTSDNARLRSQKVYKNALLLPVEVEGSAGVWLGASKI